MCVTLASSNWFGWKLCSKLPSSMRHTPSFPPASPRHDSTWKIICMKSNRTENQLHSRRARPGALGNSSCGSSRPHPKHPHTHRRTPTHTHTKHTQTWISCFHLHHAHNLQPFLASLVHSFLYPATIEIGQRGYTDFGEIFSWRRGRGCKVLRVLNSKGVSIILYSSV